MAAEKLEIIYGASPFIGQIFVHGDSLQSYLVAMIVPEKDYVMKWAKGVKALEGKSFKEVCESEELHAAIQDDLKRLFTNAGLRGFERIQKFTVDSEGWSVDNGMLTPTMKLKRQVSKNKYMEVIQELYKEGMYNPNAAKH